MNPEIMIFRYLKPYIKVLSTNGCNIWLFCVLQLSVCGILLKAQKMLGFCLFRELILWRVYRRHFQGGWCCRNIVMHVVIQSATQFVQYFAKHHYVHILP